jgi:hypothetical protein
MTELAGLLLALQWLQCAARRGLGQVLRLLGPP